MSGCDHEFVAHRLRLATVISIVLWASCSLPRPELGLSVSGTMVPASGEGSYCQSGTCNGVCADGPAPSPMLRVVHATVPVRLDFLVVSEVNQIHGDIWQGDKMAGKPIESFTLVGGARSYTTTEMKPGSRYYIAVTIGWSRLLFDRGDSTRAFLIEIVSP